MKVDLRKIRDEAHGKYPDQREYLQVVESFLDKIDDFVQKNSEFQNVAIIRRMLEPDRIIDFRISWLNGEGKEELHRGYRVQFNRSLGPYKGGFRFHPSVNLSVLKFLGFEQSLKNSLTGLQLGAGKGGSDFNPSEYSEEDVMRFCQAFAAQFFHYSDIDSDVPAGDIGVGEREIGYIFGFTNMLKRQFDGSYTGKNFYSGGSRLRPESTGYGCLYFAEQLLKDVGYDAEGAKVNISGSGNVAIFACEKAMELGMKVQTLSDSGGVVYCEDGFTEKMFKFVKEHKLKNRGRIEEFAKRFDLEFSEDKKPWDYSCKLAIPCATQNELERSDAVTLVENDCFAVLEGANMPCTNDAVQYFLENGVAYVPGKASNAGGVSVSAFEMTQNRLGYKWTKEKVDSRLRKTMKYIYSECSNYGGKINGHTNFVKGANTAGFVRLYRAMTNQGVL